MPTQRPFFANFLAAFRAQSAISQQSKAPSSGVSGPSQPSSSSNNNPSPSHARSIATSSKAAGATTSALTQLHSSRATSTSPLSKSPGPASQGAYTQTPPTENRMRRGSDSSSEGFRDVLATEKWYVGGRTATGEERFFKLGVVRRHRSIDRLSLDRLSL